MEKPREGPEVYVLLSSWFHSFIWIMSRPIQILKDLVGRVMKRRLDSVFKLCHCIIM